MNIGIIGLGIMGSRMAANLLKHGHSITVYNRTKAKANELVDAGAHWADSAAALAAQVDVVLTMLADPAAVEMTALGDDGFLQAMQPDAIWMDCSTTNPSFAQRMADAATQHGVRFVDAPVAGSLPQAEQAQLVFIVGGDAALVAQLQPIFDAAGRAVNHVGEKPGMGNALKLVINHMLATSMLAFAEGLVLGEALGIEREKLFDTLIGGPVTAPFAGSKRGRIEAGDYSAQFPLQWMQKDTQMVSIAAYENHVAMPLANATKEAYMMAMRYGYGEHDLSAIYRFLQGAD